MGSSSTIVLVAFYRESPRSVDHHCRLGRTVHGTVDSHPDQFFVWEDNNAMNQSVLQADAELYAALKLKLLREGCASQCCRDNPCQPHNGPGGCCHYAAAGACAGVTCVFAPKFKTSLFWSIEYGIVISNAFSFMMREAEDIRTRTIGRTFHMESVLS